MFLYTSPCFELMRVPYESAFSVAWVPEIGVALTAFGAADSFDLTHAFTLASEGLGAIGVLQLGAALAVGRQRLAHVPIFCSQ